MERSFHLNTAAPHSSNPDEAYDDGLLLKRTVIPDAIDDSTSSMALTEIK